ncbi:MAG: hypothetical protein ACI9JM_003064 [Halioglobus sp.]|jgi:hypothetical protein
MASSALKDSQMAMALYLRDPKNQEPPPGIEPRRLKIYEELVYNNIEGFISSGFPVLRSLYEDEDWHSLVRSFIDQHRCHSPYFLQISEEFLKFLMGNFTARECDPPFILELAHYEWVELALDVSQDTVPAAMETSDVLAAVPQLSPVAWSLAYQYPVHRIGAEFRPQEATEPTYLAVYRDRCDKVRFMEINAPVARLLELIRENSGASTQELLVTLAGEMGMAHETVVAFGREQIEQLIATSVVVLAEREQ